MSPALLPTCMQEPTVFTEVLGVFLPRSGAQHRSQCLWREEKQQGIVGTPLALHVLAVKISLSSKTRFPLGRGHKLSLSDNGGEGGEGGGRQGLG